MGFYLEKQKTGSTPYVLVDENRGYMRFEGESFHENVMEFYREIGDWLEAYLHTNFSSFTFDCELKYFNSSTAKLLLNLLMALDEHASDQKQVTVRWITSADNDLIVECGEDFQEEMEHLDFQIVLN